jgi:hypothetical protein
MSISICAKTTDSYTFVKVEFETKTYHKSLSSKSGRLLYRLAGNVVYDVQKIVEKNGQIDDNRIM